MKSIILAITLTAFTLGAFAGEACCAKEKAAAAAKNATACSATAKAACADKAATAGCPMAKGKCAHTTAKKVQSPKDSAANKS